MTSQSLQEICCCIGYPVAGNPSQYIFEKALASAGLDWRYLTLEVAPENGKLAVDGMRAMGFRGATLTGVHCSTALDSVDTLSEAAQESGEINCLVRDEQGLRGENTEAPAFLEALSDFVPLSGKKAALLGTQGIAQGIAYGLARVDVERLTVVSHNAEAAEQLAEKLRSQFSDLVVIDVTDDAYPIGEDVEILIDATAEDSCRVESPISIDEKTLRPDLVVASVLFPGSISQVLRSAKQHDAKTLDGMAAYINAAASAFKIWTGIDPDRTLMRESLEEFLGL